MSRSPLGRSRGRFAGPAQRPHETQRQLHNGWNRSPEESVNQGRWPEFGKPTGRDPRRNGVCEVSPRYDERDPGRVTDQAHRVMRLTAETIDPIARNEGWPVPFSPVRFLVLDHLKRGSAFGHTPSRLAQLLHMKPPSLAHHLDVLEKAGLIRKRPRRLWDRRKISVQLTEEGTYATQRLRRALQRLAAEDVKLGERQRDSVRDRGIGERQGNR